MGSPVQLATSFAVGASFGASLLLAGVANPKTIVGQFELVDFHMLVAFLTAASVSSLIVYASNRTGYARLASRGCAEFALPLGSLDLGTHAGNLVGGGLQGIAMAVSGACPGTVLVQTALGWGMGVWALVGQVLGGLIFVGVQDRIRSGVGKGGQVKTVYELLGVKNGSMVVVYEGVMMSVVALVSLIAPLGTYWRNAVVGGGLIGLAQLGSVLFSKKTLGVSTAYQDVAGHLWTLADGKKARPGWSSIAFALGVMTGAYVCRDSVPQSEPLMLQDHDVVDISLPAAVIGGALSAFGARLAGGCTSGHGISGCSTLSISSLVTVASMFAGGITFKALVG